MTSRQESKLSMHLAVQDYLIANTDVVTTLPNFPVFFTSFQNGISQIKIYGEEQMFNKSGLRANKERLKNTLIVLAADTSRRIQAYAKFVNNQLLLSETKFSESDLKNAANNELRDYVQGIFDRAQANLSSLDIYGINAETQTTFSDAIHAYMVSIPKPRIGITDTKQSTLRLINAFSVTQEALSNMDTIIEIVKLTQPNFYNGYKSVRKLISTGRVSLAVKGVVSDAVGGEPIKGATLSFVLDENGTTKETSKAVIKKTAEKGGYYIRYLISGIYHVAISKNGYVKQVQNIAVSDGELTVLNVQLVKN